MKPLSRESLSPVAAEILDYLSTHQDAQDTVEGIAEWWLLEQRIRIVITEVKNALAELVDQGMVVARKRQDGRVHYRLNLRKQAALDGPLAKGLPSRLPRQRKQRRKRARPGGES